MHHFTNHCAKSVSVSAIGLLGADPRYRPSLEWLLDRRHHQRLPGKAVPAVGSNPRHLQLGRSAGKPERDARTCLAQGGPTTDAVSPHCSHVAPWQIASPTPYIASRWFDGSRAASAHRGSVPEKARVALATPEGSLAARAKARWGASAVATRRRGCRTRDPGAEAARLPSYTAPRWLLLRASNPQQNA